MPPDLSVGGPPQPERDPGLILDRRNALGPAPGLHALFIGVSDYAHLTHPDDEPPGEGMAALQKLRSPALSAFRLKDSLLAMDAGGQLLKPVKTIRFLSAPSAEELQAEPLLATQAGAWPWFTAIRTAIRAWRQDLALGGAEEQGLFHFSGHGVRRMGNDAILLAADFDPAGEVLLENAFGFQNIYDAMAPNAKYPDVGRTQFYLVDACRNLPDALKEIEDPRPTPIFDVRPPLRDDRKAPVVYATRNGGTAAALAGAPTEFTTGLLWALEHGSVEKRPIPARPKPGWVICFDSMKQCLGATQPDLAARMEFTGLGAETPLCVRSDPPLVEVRMAFSPADLEGKLNAVQLLDGNSGKSVDAARQPVGAIWHTRIPTGIYRVTIGSQDATVSSTPFELENITLGKAMPWALTLGGV